MQYAVFDNEDLSIRIRLIMSNCLSSSGIVRVQSIAQLIRDFHMFARSILCSSPSSFFSSIPATKPPNLARGIGEYWIAFTPYGIYYSPARNPPGRPIVARRISPWIEEAHPCFPYFTQPPIKSNDAGSINCHWSSWFHLY